jgi:hypothetical protein
MASLRQRYRVFLERKTLGGAPWGVAVDGEPLRLADAVVIEGVCETGHDPQHEKAWSITGVGVIHVEGTRVLIRASEAVSLG